MGPAVTLVVRVVSQLLVVRARALAHVLGAVDNEDRLLKASRQHARKYELDALGLTFLRCAPCHLRHERWVGAKSAAEKDEVGPNGRLGPVHGARLAGARK